jgi:xanthine/uracil permease
MKKINVFLENPIFILLSWIFGFPFLLTVVVIVVGKMTAAGEQIPLLVLGYAIHVFVVGGLCLCIIIPIVSSEWAKKYWFIIVVAAVLFAIPYSLIYL